MTMMMKRSLLALALVAGLSAPAFAAGEAATPPKQKWSFWGPFGKYDRGQLQRGFKVYKEVCQSCHGLSLLSFRNLGDPGGPGFSPAQVTAIALDYKVQDGPNDAGEMFERQGRPADRFPKPFPNDNAARAANGGALPPDLSVIAKARTYERGGLWFILDIFTQYVEQGPDYITALLTGYEDPPKDFNLPAGASYNKYFPGHAIGMPNPLSGNDQVTYDDGAPQTPAQYAKDVTGFLMWAAEPHLDARKRVGMQVMIFLLIFAGLLYFTKKKVWAAVKAHPEMLDEKRAPTEYKRH